MAEDLYNLLGIPSAEAEAVQRVLQPTQAQAQPAPWSTVQQQAYSDYDQRLNASEDARIQKENDLALQAEVQRNINLPTFGGTRARQIAWKQAMERAMYEKQTRALMDDLTKLDPADPEAMSFQDEVFGRHPIAREALKDPRISNLVRRQASENEEMAQIFEKDPDARQEYADLKATGVDPRVARQKVKDASTRRAERIAFAMSGGKPEEFDQFVRPDGRLDRAQMAYHLSKLKNGQSQQMTSLEARQLDLAAQDVGEISDSRKRAAFRKAHAKDPVSEEEWATAYNLAEAEIAPRREALSAIVNDLERAGRQVPERYKSLAGLSASPNVPRGNEAVAPVVAQEPERVRITTKAEYDALPSGTKAIDGKGRPFTKK